MKRKIINMFGIILCILCVFSIMVLPLFVFCPNESEIICDKIGKILIKNLYAYYNNNKIIKYIYLKENNMKLQLIKDIDGQANIMFYIYVDDRCVDCITAGRDVSKSRIEAYEKYEAIKERYLKAKEMKKEILKEEEI